MASNDPGLATATALADDPTKGVVDPSGNEDDSEQPIAPDQFDERYETSRKEIWAYYM